MEKMEGKVGRNSARGLQSDSQCATLVLEGHVAHPEGLSLRAPEPGLRLSTQDGLLLEVAPAATGDGQKLGFAADPAGVEFLL